MKVTVEMFPWQGHKDRGGFRVVGADGKPVGTVSGLCWLAGYSCLDQQQKWTPRAYELREYDDQCGDPGRVIESFSHAHYLRQHVEAECNAPPREPTEDEIARTPGSAAWCETYADNRY